MPGAIRPPHHFRKVDGEATIQVGHIYLYRRDDGTLRAGGLTWRVVEGQRSLTPIGSTAAIDRGSVIAVLINQEGR
jgi:hypothetical protein